MSGWIVKWFSNSEKTTKYFDKGRPIILSEKELEQYDVETLRWPAIRNQVPGYHLGAGIGSCDSFYELNTYFAESSILKKTAHATRQKDLKGISFDEAVSGLSSVDPEKVTFCSPLNGLSLILKRSPNIIQQHHYITLQ